MIVNVLKLDAELKAAGIPIHGVSSSGRIDYKDEATQAQRDQGAAILAAHNAAPTEEQRLDRLGLPMRLVAALAIRASDRWTGLSTARKNRVMAVINNAADSAISQLS